MEATLFELQPSSVVDRKLSKANDRKRKMAIAYSYSGTKWRLAYEAFILEYATMHPDGFIAESCRIEFESRRDLPQLIGADKRASGALFMKLVRDGQLRRIGYGDSVLRSSPMPLYVKG